MAKMVFFVVHHSLFLIKFLRKGWKRYVASMQRLTELSDAMAGFSRQAALSRVGTT